MAPCGDKLAVSDEQNAVDVLAHGQPVGHDNQRLVAADGPQHCAV